MLSKCIESPHHGGKMKQLWVVLSDLASQEGCDGSPYDEMMIASEYIEELEKRFNDLSEALSPFLTSEKELMKRIEKERPEEEPALEVGPGSHKDQPVINDMNLGTCMICHRSKHYNDMATRSIICAYCGQKYDHKGY